MQLGVLVPVVVWVAVVIAPLLVSARSAFSHPMDVVVACSLSGAALSLGLSLVVQHGAFSHVQATSGDPAHVAFTALTLGFLQPIVLATAAIVAVLGIRRLGVNPVAGVGAGLALVVVYELATTLLAPYGTRGIVLTTLVAFVLAGAGLVAARNGLHAAMAADTGADTATEDTEGVEHRLTTVVVSAIIAVVVIVAAAITTAVVARGPATRPTPPVPGHGGLVPHPAAAAAAIHPIMGPSGQSLWGTLHLTSHATPLAAGPVTAVNLYRSVSVTPAPGWTIDNQGQAFARLVNADQTVAFVAFAGTSDSPGINGESSLMINNAIQQAGLTNVRQTPLGPAQAVQGTNFQQMLQVIYTANRQDDQGTWPEWGIWVTLFNPSGGLAGFVCFYSNESLDAYDAAKPDADAMLTSMLS